MSSKKLGRPRLTEEQRRVKEQRAAVAASLDVSRGYLIRIPERKHREQAIRAFLGVPFARLRLPGDRFLVLGAHIEALRRAGVPFEDITGPRAKNG